MGLWDSIYNNIKKQVRPRVEKENPIKTSCVDLDTQIKQLDITIADTRRKEISESNKAKEFALKATREVLEEIRGKAQTSFLNKKCATELENMKAKETAEIIGKEIQKYEDDVLTGSDEERSKLFIIGGATLLVALGMILVLTRKKK